MGKNRILIASVLKPVTDTRMYEKIGQSLAKLPGSEIHIFGIGESGTSYSGNIRFHGLKPFPRLSLKRLSAHWKMLQTAIQVKPDVIIANTFELLPVTILCCILFNVKIVYDIRENYAQNIRHQPTFPGWLRRFLAALVSGVQKASAPFISQFWVAEKTYARELEFLKSRFTVIENKFQPPPNYHLPQTPVSLRQKPLHLLYAGTIAEVYGIFEAISLAQQLYNLDDGTRLTIIGYCPLPETLSRLQSLIAGKPYINLVGGGNLVPHTEILQAARAANVGLLPYQPNLSTFTCIPTKLYEYMAAGMLILIQQNPNWHPMLQAADAGISIDFRRPEPETLLQQLRGASFYRNGIPADIFWQTEEEKLLNTVETLLK